MFKCIQYRFANISFRFQASWSVLYYLFMVMRYKCRIIRNFSRTRISVNLMYTVMGYACFRILLTDFHNVPQRVFFSEKRNQWFPTFSACDPLQKSSVYSSWVPLLYFRCQCVVNLYQTVISLPDSLLPFGSNHIRTTVKCYLHTNVSVKQANNVIY